jgi:hypothetical protein
MQGEKKERWMELCAQADEQDPQKLLALVKEINDRLSGARRSEASGAGICPRWASQDRCDAEHLSLCSASLPDQRDILKVSIDQGANLIMACRSCGSQNQTEFGAEINIHFPGLKNLDKPSVMAFPKLVVCLDCGFTQCTLPETELCLLKENAAA